MGSDFLQKQGENVVAFVILQGVDEDASDGEEDKGGDQGNSKANGSADKDISLDRPSCCQALCEQEQEPAANEQGTVAHADLCLTCGTEEVSKENPAPAVQTEDEALCKRVDEAKASAEQQGYYVTRIGPRPNQSG